jgi:hypothetical protein
VKLIVTSVDFPTDGEGVPPLGESWKKNTQYLEDGAREAEENMAESYAEAYPDPGPVPDDPDEIPYGV